MRFYGLLIAVLCVWRLTHLLVEEDGPWDAIVRLRRWVGDGFWGQLLDCFYCLSLWVAVPFAYLIGTDGPDRLLHWPAISAGAILLQRLMFRKSELPPAPWAEDEGDD